MSPEIAEAVKRLEFALRNINRVLSRRDVTNLIAELQRVSLELVFSSARIVERNAEIARLKGELSDCGKKAVAKWYAEGQQ